MATNKKRKKGHSSHLPKPILPRHSVTYLESCYAAARRVFRALGEDPSTFDLFTKRQKQKMFFVSILPPRIQAKQGHLVPRQYIRYIQEELIAHMKRDPVDRKTGLTAMDASTVGMSLRLIFEVEKFRDGLSPEQREVVERMRNQFDTTQILERAHQSLIGIINTSLLMLSQPNFRTYGQCAGEYPTSSSPSLQSVIRITTHECQPLRFKYHNKERTAFRIFTGQNSDVPPIGATIALSKIFPDTTHDRLLNIYIQSHAIHRFKERINTFFPMMRNQFFFISLIAMQRIVQNPNGMKLIACITPSSEGEKIIGYFAFTIDGDNLLVLTLLPLLSYNTPEGRILCERLHLSPDDLKYLGMDKLSFFYEIDIAQIPALKQVLFDELHLDYFHVVYNSFRSKGDPFDEKKTLFVKNFFQKLEEQPADYTEILADLEEPEI
jgi:hypothetical protein